MSQKELKAAINVKIEQSLSGVMEQVNSQFQQLTLQLNTQQQQQQQRQQQHQQQQQQQQHQHQQQQQQQQQQPRIINQVNAVAVKLPDFWAADPTT